jgi:hypothetical protein
VVFATREFAEAELAHLRQYPEELKPC